MRLPALSPSALTVERSADPARPAAYHCRSLAQRGDRALARL